MNIQDTVEKKKSDLLAKKILMSANLVVGIERETIIEKLQELENRIALLESKKVVK